LRTIESLYWLGVKLAVGGRQLAISSSSELLQLDQWEAYESEQRKIPSKDAFQFLFNWMNENNLDRLIAKTKIIIAPGYKPKVAKALITNFHQPRSTLLLLVSALIGSDWRKVYDYALQNSFRFLSYGDGSLLWFDGSKD